MTDRQAILEKWNRVVRANHSFLDGVTEADKENCAVALENQRLYNERLTALTDENDFDIKMFKRMSIPIVRRLFNTTPVGKLKAEVNAITKIHSFDLKWLPEVVENDLRSVTKLDAEAEYTAVLSEVLGGAIKEMIERDGDFTMGYLFIDTDGSLAVTHN